ncbi:TetR family transcriptional regulator [Brevibacillus fluminis]|uniref:TetR family transcriptional regulator n=2 Tax=Brevibacillus fluminis TaxID=511487 RepID=A0A3M8DC01_9BACL|nr:TetR family transcriptional regulator [Brevibacillus fluminis]
MPKIVDHQKRKEELAEAAWRVIRREGIDGVSVRRVAEEAGMSLGSLRHYFETQSQLLTFSMRMVSERVNQRMTQLPLTNDLRTDIELVIAQLLPLDEERCAEAEVWLAFAGKAIVDPEIHRLSLDVHDELFASFRRMIGMLKQQKLISEVMDLDLESKRLHALIDGLVVHHASFPERLSKEEMIGIVSNHLDSLLQCKN